MALVLGDPTRGAIPIIPTRRSALRKTLEGLGPECRAYATAVAFDAAPGAHLVAPDGRGAIAAVLFGQPDAKDVDVDPMAFGRLVMALPPGRYRIEGGPGTVGLNELAFLLSSYKFRRYRKSKASGVVLEAPRGPERERIETIAEAVEMGRDLINTPANDMGPSALERAAVALARRFGARTKILRGEQLLAGNFPLVHAVGKGAEEPPRLVDFRWTGSKSGPKVTLVGKGVCFDTGGLDIKPGSAMLHMKKDMGGAATALAAASMIMRAGLPVRLRVILPIVENSISARAFRPGDVYPARNGLSVEIGNTDAEGRLILADALALADEDEPDLLLDFATLTGAARVALGPDLPAYFTGDEALAGEIARAGSVAADPVWRLPLWTPYDSQLDSKVADVNNVSSGAFAGAIIAALFLRRFVKRTRVWAHFDVYNWNQSARPGRPEGGDIQAARLAFEMISVRVGGIASRMTNEI